MNDNKFIIVQWPEVQDLIEKSGFNKNSILVNNEPLHTEYGDAAYLVRETWLKKVNKEATVELYHL